MKISKFLIKYSSLKILKKKNNRVTYKIFKNNLLNIKNIKKNFLVIKVEYTNINYKDFLMFQGHEGIVRKLPHIPGIDACGKVFFSNSKKFKKNEKVFIVAQPLGVETNGSYSEFITVSDRWVEKLPKHLTPKQTMMIGTSGFTAVKAFNKSLKTILKFKNKPVLVTGATGNVGMFLIFLLTNIGVNVEAVTSNSRKYSILKKIGVTKIHILKNLIKAHNYSLLNEKYSVVFENLGGDVFSACLKYLIKKGILLSIGNVLGNTSNVNILPFILREIKIIGINAESSNKKERINIYKFFKSQKLKKNLINITKVVNLKEASRLIKPHTYFKKKFRYVVKI